MHIHEELKKLSALEKTSFVLQIGAMDGKTADPVYDALIKNDWPALLLEPLPDMFERLSQTYRHRPLVRLANIAIAEHCGTTLMYRPTPESIANGKVPDWGHGAASLYKDRTALAWDNIRPHVITETVACLTLPALIEQYDVKNIDVLVTDAEGHDYAILQQLDFQKFAPQVINVEIVNLPEDEQQACKKLLEKNGYTHKKTGYDLIAVKA